MNQARAKFQRKFDPGKDVFSGVKTGSRLVCRPCYRTHGNLIKTSVREKSRGVYLPIGWVFSELFENILLVLNVKVEAGQAIYFNAHCN